MKTVLVTSLGLAAVLGILAVGAVNAQSGGGGGGGGGGRGLAERFEVLDTDTDSQISTDEAAEWLETVFVTMDYDEDAQLTRKEFLAVQFGRGADPDNRGPKFVEKQAQKDARFTKMDADGDGYVTREQFFADGRENFITADSDSSGSLSISEFVAAEM